ncbi:MAG: TIR domain-containing protein [Anaerolineae bacterium]|nr:TIR domain-containing protein [Anaerolineae bacterium]
MSFDLFISHSSKDNEITRKIHDRLTAAGIDTWVDFIDIRAGDEWDAKIQEALHSAKRAVIVLSQASLDSTHCKGEWQTFVDRKLTFYTLKVEAVKDDEIPYYLKTRQITDLTSDVDNKLTTLIAVLGGTAISTPPPAPKGKISSGFPRWHLDIPIYGREDDLQKVRTVLDGDKAPHIVQITGIGGVGKSRLAAEIVNTATYADGAIWHDCRITSLSTLAATIREQLGLPPMTDEQTWDALDNHAMLIVLDNGEDCPEPAAYSAVMNRWRGQARIILTSRMRWLDLRAPERSLVQPDKGAATQIMQEFAAQKAPERDLKGMADQLAEAAYRHPRLMEHAASWLNDMTVNDVLAELQSLKSPDAQEALHEMILRSVDRVRSSANGETAIMVLRKLAVCRGGFTAEAAKAIAGEEDFGKALKSLRNWGLLRFEGERYEIDPLVIETVGEDVSVLRAHFKYFEALARKHDEKQDYAALERDSVNLEVAFKRAIDKDDTEYACWIANACSNFQVNRGRFTQFRMWLSQVRPLILKRNDIGLFTMYAFSLGMMFQCYPFDNKAHNLRNAINTYEQIFHLYSQKPMPIIYAMVQYHLGLAYYELSKIEERVDNLRRAIDASNQALHFYNSDSTPVEYAGTQNNLGNAYADLAEIENPVSNLQRAIDAYGQALRYRTPNIMPLSYAMTLNNLGTAYHNLALIENRLENIDHAITVFKQALCFRTPSAAPLDYAMTQYNLGIAYKDNNKIEEAIQCWCEAEKYYRLMGLIEESGELKKCITDAGGTCE